MWLKKIITSCISGPKESQEGYPVLNQRQEIAISNIYYKLGHKNQQEEITLEVLKALKELKGEDKKSFLADAKDMIPNNRLHELNKKIMEHALDLIDSKDSAFLLRIPADAILRDLLFLEAKGNKFTAEIDKKGTLIINFPSGVLELYKLLINNFYFKKFEKEELQKKLYQELLRDCEIPFEKLIEEKELQKKLYQELLPDYKIPFEKLNFLECFIECLKEFYIKKSLAQSIICLFVSKYIREHDVCEELFKLDRFKKALESDKFKALRELSNYNEDAKARFNSTIVDDVLNDVNGVYINNLTHSQILDLVIYSQPNNKTLESIEISGDTMTFETLV